MTIWLARGIDTNDEWIVTRTGIRSRHLAEPGATASELGLISSPAGAGNGWGRWQ